MSTRRVSAVCRTCNYDAERHDPQCLSLVAEVIPQGPGHAVVVSTLPACDICVYVQGIERSQAPLAIYDGATVSGPWANMCRDHFPTWGQGTGTGRGQRLVLVAD